MSNQRDHFRLQYPVADRPTLILGKAEYLVLDLSERGIKFTCPPTFKPKPDSTIKGTVKFQDGSMVEIVGKVLRLSPDNAVCVVLLTQGVPLPKMMEEQRYLLKKYRAGS